MVMRILFTGVGRRIELIQAFRNAALVLGKELMIFGADLTGTAPALAFCDRACQTVPMNDPSYIENLLQICQREKIDLIIPTIDTDLLVLSENRDRFDAVGTKVMISAPNMIHICRDKNNTSSFFEKCQLHAPTPVNDWRLYVGEYPAFIKPKDGSSSINAFKARNRDELVELSRKVNDYIVQPFISGQEYTVDIFCDWNGSPVWIVPRKRLQVRAGEVLKTEISMDPQIISDMKRLCAVFKPCGPLTVQLIRDDTGCDWYIEINPRFGGGAPLSMKAGAKSAESILKLLSGETIDYCDIVSDGAIYSRFDQSVCINEGSNSIFRGVIFDLDDTLYSEKEYVRSGYLAVASYLGNESYANIMWEYFEAKKPAIDELLKSIGRFEERDQVVNVYRSHLPSITPYEGVVELIKCLKGKGIKVGIITDGRPEGQRNKIKALGLENLVDDIIITDELGGPQFRKPCDISFRILQTKWRLPAAEIIYIGDNPNKDFQAPKQLGIQSIWFRNDEGIYHDSTCTVLPISSISQLANKLLKLGAKI